MADRVSVFVLPFHLYAKGWGVIIHRWHNYLHRKKQKYTNKPWFLTKESTEFVVLKS